MTRAPRTIDAFDTESQWSPDGTTLALTRVLSGSEAAIFTVRVDGTGLRQLTPYRLDAGTYARRLTSLDIFPRFPDWGVAP